MMAAPIAVVGAGLKPGAPVVLFPTRIVGGGVEARHPCWLVLADTFFPGWTVTVDGEPRSIARANTAFRAVAVGPGDQVVEFRYEPLSFRLGLIVSAGAALALLAVGGAALVRRRAARPPPPAAGAATSAA